MVAIPGPEKLYKIFYAVTGVGLITLILGFGSCLFDLERVPECVEHAEYAVHVLERFGNHIIEWFFAVVREIMHR